MHEHFRAFSFVDRIVSMRPGAEIHGLYTIPPGLPAFSPSLVCEAIGQTGGWLAMASLEFKRRPVASLVASCELLAEVRPGQVLELASDMESVDEVAAAYNGTAHADGVPVARLRGCIGAMLPVEELDDPAAVRQRFALLSGAGADPGGFEGLPPLALDEKGGETGQRKKAALRVPTSAPFFADHFPRRPLFPGTLIASLNLELARSLAAEVPAPSNGGTRGSWRPARIDRVKFRAFTPPGAQLEFEARVQSVSGGALVMALECRDSERVIGNCKAHFIAQEKT